MTPTFGFKLPLSNLPGLPLSTYTYNVIPATYYLPNPHHDYSF